MVENKVYPSPKTETKWPIAFGIWWYRRKGREAEPFLCGLKKISSVTEFLGKQQYGSSGYLACDFTDQLLPKLSKHLIALRAVNILTLAEIKLEKS